VGRSHSFMFPRQPAGPVAVGALSSVASGGTLSPRPLGPPTPVGARRLYSAARPQALAGPFPPAKDAPPPPLRSPPLPAIGRSPSSPNILVNPPSSTSASGVPVPAPSPVGMGNAVLTPAGKGNAAPTPAATCTPAGKGNTVPTPVGKSNVTFNAKGNDKPAKSRAASRWKMARNAAMRETSMREVSKRESSLREGSLRDEEEETSAERAAREAEELGLSVLGINMGESHGNKEPKPEHWRTRKQYSTQVTRLPHRGAF